nr:unnamed protein product [Callosobruchus analis]
MKRSVAEWPEGRHCASMQECSPSNNTATAAVGAVTGADVTMRPLGCESAVPKHQLPIKKQKLSPGGPVADFLYIAQCLQEFGGAAPGAGGGAGAARGKLGFADLKNLQRALDRHSKSKEHLASQCKIKLFGKQNIAASIHSARKTAIISYNNQVRENRNNLKKLIDITIYLAGKDLAFRGHNESSESYNRGNYKELVSLFEKYDDNFNKFINNNVFSGTSKTIQNDLIDSVSYILKEHIESEIGSTSVFPGKLMKQLTSLAFRNYLL